MMLAQVGIRARVICDKIDVLVRTLLKVGMSRSRQAPVAASPPCALADATPAKGLDVDSFNSLLLYNTPSCSRDL